MKKYISLLVILIIVSCNQTENKSTTSQELVYDINGNWCFLNKSGVYTESFFSNDFFKVYNQYLGLSPDFKYHIIDDTLFSTFYTGKKLKTQKSVVTWVNEDKVVLRTGTGADTMERITNGNFSLGVIDPVIDSVNFTVAFSKRNDNYLIDRGILTKEEVEAFRKNQTIPEDVQEKLK
jgi:hypothetical protein